MHYRTILERFGCTPLRFREIFTAEGCEVTDEMSQDEKEAARKKNCDVKIRKKLELRFWDRILAGVQRCSSTSDLYQAIDMAWDGPPIIKQMRPLMMFAQGKIKVTELRESLLRNNCGDPALVNKFFKRKDATSDELELDLPRICETHVNLVRSYLQRRHAAMEALWANLYPLFRYDPRGKSPVKQLLADVVTEKIDIMDSQFGYREQGTQWRRTMLMYSESTVFPKNAWTTKKGIRYEQNNLPADENKVESYTIAEGVDFVNPHPSRVYSDESYPRRAINTDTGPRWIGHWDIIRFGTLWDDNDTDYYNTKKVFNSEQWNQNVGQFPDFFNYYFDPCVLDFPQCESNEVRWNDRKANVGKYAGSQRDTGVLITNHFEKINPKAEGICDYDADVWVRFIVAGSGTVIGAEPLPGAPACYGGINVNENRIVNQSMSSELLGLQDQMTNTVTHMIEALRAAQVKIWLIDKDSIEAPVRKEIEKQGKNQTWWQQPHVISYSSSKFREMTLQNPIQSIQLIKVDIGNMLTQSLQAMGQILNLADRLLILSPNELGQPNPREVAAREVQEISTSVQSIYSFINMGPRMQITAVKKLLYTSLVTNGDPTVQVPVMRKYTKKTVEDAGFTVVDEASELEDGDYIDAKQPIRGPLNRLVYDYYFDTRDGAERSVNTEGAKALAQMLQILMQTPQIPQLLGLDRLLDIVNSIIRMSGAPTDLQIERDDGESDQVPDQPQQAQAQPGQAGQPGQPAQPPQALPPGAAPQALPQGQPTPQAQDLVATVQQMGQQIQQLRNALSSLITQGGIGQGQSGATTIPRGVSPTPAAPLATRLALSS